MLQLQQEHVVVVTDEAGTRRRRRLHQRRSPAVRGILLNQVTRLAHLRSLPRRAVW